MFYKSCNIIISSGIGIFVGKNIKIAAYIGAGFQAEFQKSDGFTVVALLGKVRAKIGDRAVHSGTCLIVL